MAIYTDGSGETVSKLLWYGPSALCCLLQLLPGASPQADMDRALGASNLKSQLDLSAESAMLYQMSGAKPQERSNE